MEFEFSQNHAPIHGIRKYHAEFEGQTSEKNRVIQEVIAALEGDESFSREEKFSLRLCLDEAIQNAISHGNGDDLSKKVQFSIYSTGDRWELIVRDEGDGFQPEKVHDPREKGGLEQEGGRGILILLEYMDGIKYYDGGRTLVISKRIRSHPSAL